jgi:regulator of RNase E activity RraA
MSAVLKAFEELSTPLVADACRRLGLPLRVAPPGIAAVLPGDRIAGRVLPVRHYGSVDVFLEAFGLAGEGDVLVVDNGGRRDEACVGDLAVLEAKAAQVTGVVIWGLHRDTRDIIEIGLPVFSYGAYPPGPVRLDDREADALLSARVGEHLVTADDVVLGDEDGVLFVASAQLEPVLGVADGIRATEREQAGQIRAGRTLREQTRFAEYLAARAEDPAHTFRKHLRRIGGAIEE